MCIGIPRRGEERLRSQLGVPGNSLSDVSNSKRLRGLAVSCRVESYTDTHTVSGCLLTLFLSGCIL